MLNKSLRNVAVDSQKLAADTTSQPKPRVAGSWKNKITCSEFVEERAICDFDKEDLANGLYGAQFRKITRDAYQDMEDHPEIASHPSYYEMSPIEK